MYYNSTPYFYILNLQGDVIRMVDGVGNIVANYEYDPYGKVISATGWLAEVNPLRYRGYYYDTETQLYHLWSRYYDPQTCRFINADGLASTGQGVLGYNMYAYCNNSPVIYVDRGGYVPDEAVDINGDGELDYYVYTYTYTKGFWFWKKQATGKVYIYVNKERSYFEQKSNVPSGFNSATDLIVADYTESSNPNMYAYRADRVKDKYRDEIVDCMLEYDEDFDTGWNRTKKSLMVEWREHHRYALFSARARNVDFDNAEEGKGFVYFAKKAWNAVFK